ncbi:MAG: hypothetical protein EXR72_19400 [Myxococcales bacterium]|nr:hypothetical protein [Myxococcales bacterium]
MIEDLLGRVDRLRSEWRSRLEVDVPGMVAGVRTRLESRLALTPLPVDADLADRRGRFGLGRVRTWAFESQELRKAVIAHVSLRPVVSVWEGLVVTLAPRRDLHAPIFAADLMVLPTQVSASADVYGPAALTAGLLHPLAPSIVRLGGGAGPEWTRGIGSGEGLHARVSARLVDELFAALTGGLGRYLDALLAAPRGGDSGRAQADFFAAFHAHGPRTGPLAHLLGSAWAERYSRLLFE